MSNYRYIEQVSIVSANFFKAATPFNCAPTININPFSPPSYQSASHIPTDKPPPVEPCRQEKYHPVNGSLITLAAKNKEIGYQIVAYEPSEVILKRIENSLESLSKKVGGVAGLINMLGLLYKKK